MKKLYFLVGLTFILVALWAWFSPTNTIQSAPEPIENQQQLQQELVPKKKRPVSAKAHSAKSKTWLKGRVIDPEGRPLKDVTIRIIQDTVPNNPFPNSNSDDRGFFRIAWPDQATGSLTFTAPGYRKTTFDIKANGPFPLIVLTPTSRGDAQVIRIVDEAGEPIHQAKVFRYPGEVLDAALGEVTIDNFPEIHKLNIYADGFVRKIITQFDSFENPQTISLSRTWTLRGRVTDRQSGDAIEHCQLEVELAGEKTTLEVPTQNGFFSVPDLPAKMNLIEIKAWGHQAHPIDHVRNDEIKTRSEEVHFFELGDMIFRGTVWDPQGVPVENAVVHFLYIDEDLLKRAEERRYLRDREKYLRSRPIVSPFSSSEPRYSGSWHISQSTWPDFHTFTTDETGTYSLKPESENAKFDLFVDASGFHPFFVNRADQVFARNQGSFDIHLQKYASISVEVGQADSPLQRHIFVEDAKRNEYDIVLNPGETHFEISDLPKGRIRLHLYGLSHQNEQVRKDDLGIQFPVQGIARDRKSIVLTTGKHYVVRLGFNSTCHLGGRAFWDGEPMANQTLEIYPIDQKNKMQEVLTNNRGFFSMERLPKAIYEIRLAHEEPPRIRNLTNTFALDLQKNQYDVTLDFFSSGTVFGQVLDPPGNAFLELTHYQETPWKELINLAEARSSDKISQFVDPDPSYLYFSKDPESLLPKKIRIPLDPSGLFQFEHIPPGWVDLTLHLEEGIQTLVHSAIMPIKGEDLDLGKLKPNNRGQLEIVFAGGERFANEVLEIDFSGRTIESHITELSPITSKPVGPPIVIKAPKGTLNIWVFSERDEMSGFDIQQPIQVQIEPRKTTKAIIDLVPITYLQIDGEMSTQSGDLSVEIRNLDTGTHYQLKNDEDFTLGPNAGFSISTSDLGVHRNIWFQAKRVPEGTYRIDFTFSNQRARFFVFLQAGEPLDLDLKPSDFVWLQP